MLLGTFSLFLFHKQVSQQRQLEEVNAAEAIRYLRDAVRAAVIADKDAWPEGITLRNASEFLSRDYLSGFRVAIRREGRKLSAVIVSPTSLGRHALNNLSAGRISSMLGGSGGLLPEVEGSTSALAIGTLKLWTLDIASISADFATPVRVVVNIEFADIGNEFAEEKEKLLYRTNEYGDPSNTMLTKLFFNDNSQDTIILDPAAGSITASGQVQGLAFSNSGGTWFVDASGNMGNANYTVGANGAVTFKAISGTTGTFSGALKAASGDFGTGAVTAGAGNFSGIVRSSAAATVGEACSGGQIATSGGTTLICSNGRWTNGGETDCIVQGYYTNSYGYNAGYSIIPHGSVVTQGSGISGSICSNSVTICVDGVILTMLTSAGLPSSEGC
ncbi:hypothetical protein FACS1894186_8370 [Alphaproteobacteria bacterium]|nr:hypothetical protein FACS1894186_8370 [Alphaproteobacteria bacterium]